MFRALPGAQWFKRLSDIGLYIAHPGRAVATGFVGEGDYRRPDWMQIWAPWLVCLVI